MFRPARSSTTNFARLNSCEYFSASTGGSSCTVRFSGLTTTVTDCEGHSIFQNSCRGRQRYSPPSSTTNPFSPAMMVCTSSGRKLSCDTVNHGHERSGSRWMRFHAPNQQSLLSAWITTGKYLLLSVRKCGDHVMYCRGTWFKRVHASQSSWSTKQERKLLHYKALHNVNWQGKKNLSFNTHVENNSILIRTMSTFEFG